MKYLVIELQTGADGSVANIVRQYDGRNEAESAYYGILSAAAVSQVPVHAAVVLNNAGELIFCRCFEHGGDS